MAQAPRLDLRQTQSLTMTPRLQQAIKLLQMSALELENFVAEELERNPFLQKEGEPQEADADESAPFEDSEFVGRDELPALVDKDDANEAPPDMPDYTDEDSFYEHAPDENAYDGGDFSSDLWRGQASADDSFDAVSVCAAPAASLESALMEQIATRFSGDAERQTAFFILQNCDDNYFVPPAVKEKFLQSGKNGALYDDVLTKMRSFEPTGVFAASLSDFFAAQLKEKDRFDPAMARLVEHLDLLADKEYGKLMKLCGVDAEDLAQMIDELRRLNPRCSTNYGDATAPVIVPDVLVRKNKAGDFVVELNQAALPRVLMNHRYLAEISAAAKGSKEVKKFVSEHLSSANSLIKALQQRADSILKTASCIVAGQRDFFERGASFIKPMILKDVAQAAGLHESTISRVTTNKYLACAFGVFELKFFFSKALESADGETVSAVAVKQRIKRLTDEETPQNVLSDEDLTVLLNKEGIAVARRTVAKYRESLNIPPSSRRKREKRMQNNAFASKMT